MVAVCGLLFLIGGLVLACISGRYEGDIFFRMGSWIYDILQKRGIRLQGSTKVRKDLDSIHSVLADEEKCREFYVGKIRLIIMIVLGGTVLSLLVWGKNKMEEVELKEIPREEAGGGVREIQLEARVGKEKYRVWLDVGERLLKEEEVEAKLKSCIAEMEKVLVSSQYAGPTDISALPESVEGYPFEIMWRRTGEKSVTGYFYYGEQMFVHDFSVDWRAGGGNRSMEEKLRESIEEENVQTGQEEYLRLPAQLEGETLSWREVKEDSSGVLLLLALLAATGVYFLKDKDLHDEWLKRKRAMRMSYPMVLNKFVLFLGAGMTVRGSFIKIVRDWEKKEVTEGGEIYQEMLYACNELNAGVSEGLVYQRFGQRTGLEEYTRFSAMLSQNLKKGNTTLLARLREESDKAQKENVHIRKKMGEEAQTKLLVPMIMMMGIVMFLVILPAFSAF